ncbi:hypothetical protein BH23GEM7_BH23GEM7_17670 [soil metagenome]
MPVDRTRIMAAAALAVALLSLAGNFYLLRQLQRPERWARPALQRLAEQITAEDARIRYEVRLPPGTPLQLDIPVNERFVVQVDTMIPIDTNVRLPIRSPLGNYSVNVPVQANVPLRGALPLQIRHTFQLRTQTSSEIVIPLEIRLRDLPLDSLLRGWEP